MELIITLIFALLGIIFGSFATAVAYRLPRNLNFMTDRSKCSNCQHVLGVLDLFPVLSWVILRGKCRYCKSFFGFYYIILEMSLAVAFMVIGRAYGVSIESLLLCYLALNILIALSAYINDRYLYAGIIPNIAIAGALFQLVTQTPLMLYVLALTLLSILYYAYEKMRNKSQKENVAVNNKCYVIALLVSLAIWCV